MRVAVVGAGNVGRPLAGALVAAGHVVTLSAAHPERAAEVAREVGARAATSAAAVEDAELVVLAVPYGAVAGLVAAWGDRLAGRVVVDVTNRFDPQTLDGSSNAEQIQALLPGARVVKAFNTLFAANLAGAPPEGIQVDGFLAGDNAAARATVAELLRQLGFRPVDTGPLVMARALEAMALLNINLNLANGWGWRTAWKLLGPAHAV